MNATDHVRAWHEPTPIPTYPLPAADKHPAFFEKRVYQGSSGKVYPLPFHTKLSDTKRGHNWHGWFIENQHTKVMLLPELGGRIQRAIDKTNGYDLFYHNPVIKPALVGLAGPWISGGVEFNWPQHHRPSTYMPTDVAIQAHDDGSQTIWMSEHEPMNRMKGMVGISLKPGSSAITAKVRLYNRTPHVQTFLWWANVAAQVHRHYQSFFPPDVTFVADHAARAMSSFPIARDHYYGVDYRPGTDLSWYKNIPVPTSYMVMKTGYNFFGGYDHAAESGFVHVANRHISPGKKQWTWGNAEFGWAWDRELTDARGDGEHPPYVELMAGVYTDNQPDFSYLMPYETKTFTQTWWPIHKIGVAHNADEVYAIHASVEDGQLSLGLASSQAEPATRLRVTARGEVLYDETAGVAPGKPAITHFALPAGCQPDDLHISVIRGGVERLGYTPDRPAPDEALPPTATEPPAPADIISADELYLTGEHLQQYRHPTRQPEAYWQEALRRDPGDARCNAALGEWLLKREDLVAAEQYLRRAIDRLRFRHPNPEDGRPLYMLGFVLRWLGKPVEAYDWFYKATWNYAWRSAGHYQLACLDLLAGRDEQAAEHLDAALDSNQSLSHASVLLAEIDRSVGRHDRAKRRLTVLLKNDPLDHLARFEMFRVLQDCGDSDGASDAMDKLCCSTRRDPHTLLDLALDYRHAGMFDTALAVLNLAEGLPPATLLYIRAEILDEKGQPDAAQQTRCDAAHAPVGNLMPSRHEEAWALRAAAEKNAEDAQAPRLLGNLLYDKRRYGDAIAAWETSRDRDPGSAATQRNLGLAYFNVRGDFDAASQSYDAATSADPEDAQLLYESDQLAKKHGHAPADRLARLDARPHLTDQRDDLCIERVGLLNLIGRHADARDVLEQRRFHPWEGGEGQVLGQFVATYLALGVEHLQANKYEPALALFTRTLSPPKHLGEARHPLASTADLHIYLATAYARLGDDANANRHHQQAAEGQQDFTEMQVQPYSKMTWFKAFALQMLERTEDAQRELEGLRNAGESLQSTDAKIDYFATSLPDLLVFNDDLQARRITQGMFFVALAHLGLGRAGLGINGLQDVMRREPSHLPAAQMLRHYEVLCG